MSPRQHSKRLPSRRWESLRTTLWFVPAILVAAVGAIFLVTCWLDRAPCGRR